MPPNYRPGSKPSAFDSFQNNTVSVVKNTGERIGPLKAAVATGAILIQRPDVLIEVGDVIEQKMSNGATDSYEVLDPGFHEEFQGIPAGYQVKTRKLGLAEAQKHHSVTINLNGANSRVNNHSVDNSQNNHRSTVSFAENLEQMRVEIRQSESGAGLADGLELVDALEDELSKEKPSKVAIKTLAKGLPGVGSIASIVSLIIQAL